MDTSPVCPKCSYACQVPHQVRCAECGQQLFVQLASGPDRQLWRFAAAAYFFTVFLLLGVELLSQCMTIFGDPYPQTWWERESVGMQAYLLAYYGVMFVCVAASLFGMVTVTRNVMPVDWMQLWVRRLIVASLAGCLWFLILPRVQSVCGGFGWTW